MKKLLKSLLAIICIILTFYTVVYASSTIAKLRKSNNIPWQGTKNGSYDNKHNVGDNYLAEQRFSFENGTTKGINGIVYDNKSGLTWESQGNSVTKNLMDSIKYCENLTKGGYSDWRLSTLMEIQGIIDYSRTNPAIDTNFFSLGNNNYWTSTSYSLDRNMNWIIAHHSGGDHYANINEKYLYLCVRGN